MAGKSLEEVKADLAKARAELDKIEEAVNNPTPQSASDCSCDNPGCSGVEVYTYAVAVGASFAGGVSG